MHAKHDGFSHEVLSVDPRNKYKRYLSPHYDKNRVSLSTQLQHWNQKKSERHYLMHRLTVHESNQSYCGRQTIQRRSNSHHTTHMVTGALFISRPFSHLPVGHPVKDMYSNCNKPCRAHRPVLRLQRTGPDQRLLDTRCTVSKVIHGRASYCFHRALIRILPILKFISDCNFACQYFCLW